MSTYKRKTVRYVNESIRETSARLVVEGDKIREARLVNSYGSTPFVTFREMQEAIACLTEVIRRFNEEATTEYAENKEAEAISIDRLPGSGQDTLPFEQ